MKTIMIFPLALLTATCLANEAYMTCAGEPDNRLRLACYDALSGRPVEASALPPSSAPVASDDAAGKHQTGRQASLMQAAWELGDEDKRRDFIIRTYHPNFLLPVHYTSNINRTPASPTRAGGALNPNYRALEAKLQISLRAKVVEDLLLPGADLWVAYTQRSLWQLWDRQDSAPFRSTDYQPEMIYVVPVPDKLGALPFGWQLRMLQLGAAHQSNGQSDPLSRSWNRVYLGAGLEHGDFSLMLRANQRLDVRNSDDNPDLVDYIGRGEVAMAWSRGISTYAVTWHTSLHSLSRGSLQVDWTYPVFARQPSGLRWYAQLFTGYGETLLDYNHRQTSIGVGLSLFQF
jgi:phospholipase A1